MSNTVHPTPATSAGAGAVATSTQRPPLRRGGSARHCRTMPPSPRPFAPPFSPRKARPLVPRDLRPPLRSLRGSRPRYRAHGAATARISRPCFVSGAVFRPLLLPAPASFRVLCSVRSYFPPLLRWLGWGVLCSTWNSSHLLSTTLHLLSATLQLLSDTLHLLSAVGFLPFPRYSNTVVILP